MLIFQHVSKPEDEQVPRMIGDGLSRREREIMDVLYRLGEATGQDVLEGLSDPPSYSAVRSILRILEEKGHVKHVEDGKRYVFLPTQPKKSAASSALHQVMDTFFGGSLENTVRTFLSEKEANVSDEELTRLQTLIEKAKRKEQR